jgi:predicted peroxiredoxin
MSSNPSPNPAADSSADTPANSPANSPADSPAKSAANSPASSRPLVIKLTSGIETPEKVSQAFTVAAMALASGARVSVWLTGESAWLAVPGQAENFSLPYAAVLSDLRDAVIADGELTVCSQCAARRDLTEADLLPGAKIRGAAAFVEEVLAERAQALVY